MDLPSQKSAHGEDSELKLMQTAHQEGIHHVESITVPAQDAKRIERLVVLKQDLTIVLLLSGCAFFNFLVRLIGASTQGVKATRRHLDLRMR